LPIYMMFIISSPSQFKN